MILGQTQLFNSPEEALIHYGKKGMRWGVRNEDEPSGSSRYKVEKTTSSIPRTDAEKRAARRAMAKKAAIGAGILTAVAGAGFVAYKLNQSGNLPMSSIRKTAKIDPKKVAEAKKFIHEQKDVIHLSRGKHTGGTFLKKGDTPNFFTHWENAFAKEVGDADTSSVFQKLASGGIAAAFPDSENRKDFAGRPISHQVIIPKIMTSGIESIEDVQSKIWPLLKSGYDAFYTESEKNPIKK